MTVSFIVWSVAAWCFARAPHSRTERWRFAVIELDVAEFQGGKQRAGGAWCEAATNAPKPPSQFGMLTLWQ